MTNERSTSWRTQKPDLPHGERFEQLPAPSYPYGAMDIIPSPSKKVGEALGREARPHEINLASVHWLEFSGLTGAENSSWSAMFQRQDREPHCFFCPESDARALLEEIRRRLVDQDC